VVLLSSLSIDEACEEQKEAQDEKEGGKEAQRYGGAELV